MARAPNVSPAIATESMRPRPARTRWRGAAAHRPVLTAIPSLIRIRGRSYSPPTGCTIGQRGRFRDILSQSGGALIPSRTSLEPGSIRRIGLAANGRSELESSKRCRVQSEREAGQPRAVLHAEQLDEHLVCPVELLGVQDRSRLA